MTARTRIDLGWVPAACTLPTAERPLRVSEFDALFTAALRDVTVLGPRSLRLTLTGGAGVAAVARDLAARETACCSFFVFTVSELHGDGDGVVMTVEVDAAHTDVLAALADRAAALAG